MISPEQEEKNREENKKFVDDYLKNVVLPVFPKQYASGVSNSGSVDNWHLNPIIHLASHFRYFKDSPYYYSPLSKQFIHYTSFENLFNILREKSIRMNDANFMEDNHECLVGMDKLKLTKDAKDSIGLKSLISMLSFNEYDSESENGGEDLQLWRQYGKNGEGCAIVFELEGDPDLWDNFILSKVYYTEKDYHHFSAMSTAHDSFTKGKMRITQSFLPDSTGYMPMDLIKMLSFHKLNIYNGEKEIRLIYYVPWMDSKYKDLKITLNRKFERCHYYPLRIKSDNYQTPESSTPMFHLKKVIVGYKHPAADISKIQRGLRELAAYTNGHSFDVQLSSLSGQIS